MLRELIRVYGDLLAMLTFALPSGRRRGEPVPGGRGFRPKPGGAGRRRR